MIRFKNGFKFTYKVAAGALGFDGRGWPWEFPFRWLKLLRPEEFLITTKTLTSHPIKGNLSLLHPWTAVLPIGGNSFVNAVALTNPGLSEWAWTHYHTFIKNNYQVALSIAPDSILDAASMAMSIQFQSIQAIELNPRCPNLHQGHLPLTYLLEMIHTFRKWNQLPLILKLGYRDITPDLLQAINGKVDALVAINAVPWDDIYPNLRSPLEKYGYKGSVSGAKIRSFARQALHEVKRYAPDLPFISGGAMDSYEEGQYRRRHGAHAVEFGSHFIFHPTAPNKIIRRMEENPQPENVSTKVLWTNSSSNGFSNAKPRSGIRMPSTEPP